MLLQENTQENEADLEKQCVLQPVLSNVSQHGKEATITRNTSDVPVIQFNGPNDPELPSNFPNWRKVAITVLVLWATLVTLSDGTLFTAAHEAIAHEFGVDKSKFAHTYWPVTTWALGAATFALFILPLMEDFGHYYGFLGSWLCMIIFIIPQATAHNFATIVVTRFLVGGCVGNMANSTGNVIIALWPDHRTSSAIVGLWVVFYMVGNSIGSVVGAAIFQFLSWRWIFYMQLIYYLIMFPFYAVILKETRSEAILARNARRLRKQGTPCFTPAQLGRITHRKKIIRSTSRSVRMLFTELVVVAIALWSAFTLGTIYLFTQSGEQIFVTLYDWTAIQAGYVQATIVIGGILSWFMVIMNDYIHFRSKDPDNPDQPLPEAHLYPAIPGGFLGVTTGMFIYPWTSYSYLPWIAPAIGLAVVGWGSVVIVNAAAKYLVDSYAWYAGSAIAAMALGENLFIAFLPLASQSMYTTLEFQWAWTLLALVSLLLSCIPIVLIKFGKHIRQHSPFIKEASLP